MPFHLSPLPYSNDALMPALSPETLSIHHDKHHAKYIEQTNERAQGTEFAEMSLKEVMLKASGPLYESAAQAWNHDFLWKSMAPAKGQKPRGPLFSKIETSFGSFDQFKAEFKERGEKHFGSGWVWLAQKADGGLEIQTLHDADNPLRAGGAYPLLCCDVWEHAYYIDYRNKRPDYLEAYFTIANWDFAEANLR